MGGGKDCPMRVRGLGVGLTALTCNSVGGGIFDGADAASARPVGMQLDHSLLCLAHYYVYLVQTHTTHMLF